MRFDKEKFKVRLDFFIRQWLAISDLFGDADTDAVFAENFISIIFTSSMRICFELRDPQIVYFGTHELFESFANILQIGLNQLKYKVGEYPGERLPTPLSIVKQELMIKETVEDLADDIEELFKQPVEHA